MKKFIAVFMGAADGEAMKKWNAMDEEARKKKENEGKNAWMKWVQKNASFIVEQGSPLGKTKRIDAGGVSNINNLMAAYTVVEAESHEAAAKLFLNHPHFTIFPGESVELMECIPIP